MEKIKKKMRPLLFSREECAELLGCGLSKIDQVIQSGDLISFKFLGQRKVHSKDLWDFAMNLRNAGIQHCDLEV